MTTIELMNLRQFCFYSQMHIFVLHKIIIFIQKKTNDSEETALNYDEEKMRLGAL